MEAAVWTLIVVLAAVAFGNVWWLGSRIDNVLLTVGARLDQTNLRIDSFGPRQDETNARIDVHVEEHRRGA